MRAADQLLWSLTALVLDLQLLAAYETICSTQREGMLLSCAMRPSAALHSLAAPDDGPEETTYIMQRPAGGGTIVGGCYQVGKTDPEPDPDMGDRILQRAVKLVPSVGENKGVAGLDVVRQGVGLRPVRKGGLRVEREDMGEWFAVHNYGHGGAGYQCSYGCALEAVRQLKEKSRQAKL